MTIEVANSIVDMVSKETGKQLKFHEFAIGDTILAKSNRGGLYIIHCYGFKMSEYIVRSLLKVKNPRNRYTWLINGQSSRNTMTIWYWDEDHRYKLTPEQFENYRLTLL